MRRKGLQPGEGKRGRRIGVVVAVLLSGAAHVGVLWWASGLGARGLWEPEKDDALERVYVSFDAPAPTPELIPERAVDGEAGLDGIAVADVLGSIDAPERGAESGVDLLRALVGDGAERERKSLADELVGEEVLAALEGGMPEVGFAGLGASNARSIVYVVDASGSMVGTLPMVVDELARSIMALDPAQRFQVVFMTDDGSGRGYAMGPRVGSVGRSALNLALPDYKRAVLEWCRGVRAGGRSDPVPALEAALGMRPDAVFLFSRTISLVGPYEQDWRGKLAELRERVLAQLDELNPRLESTGSRRTVIKVVQFYETDPSGLFRAIAAAHGGDGAGDAAYRFITREEGSLR